MQIVTCSSPHWLSFAAARSLPRNFATTEGLIERTASAPLSATGPIRKWRTAFLFDYEVFPRSIMRHACEWHRAGRPISVGDVIVQRAVFPPLGCGLCLQFAVRISRFIDEPRRLGFAYETLAGHAERGVSEFYFEERSDGVYFVIHTVSRPAHWTSRLVRHVFTDPYQSWCTRQALAHVQRTFTNANRPDAGG